MHNVVLALLYLAVIVIIGGPCFVLAMTWDRAPWWRKYPTLRRQIDDDKDRVKIYKIRKRHPKAFEQEKLK